MSDNEAPAGTPVAPPEQEEGETLPDEPITAEEAPVSTDESQAIEPPTAEEAPSAGQPHEAPMPDTARLEAETSTRAEQSVRESASQVAAATQEAPPKTEMEDVFSEEYTYPRPRRGDIRMGRIIVSTEQGMMVDLGLKWEGLIPAHDLQRVGSDVAATVSPGEQIPVYIVRPEHDQEGHILVSWHRARQEQDWVDAQQLYERGALWEGPVKGYNRGGLIVPFGKIRGFVPASHVTGISRRMGQASLQARLAEMVGKTLHLKVLEVNRQKRRLIFSERIARRQWRTEQREKLLDELQEGDQVHGVVSNVCDFGAFIDIGGTDGLVHISELSWRRTKHPSEVISTGDEVDAYVLRVDRDRRRIGLSLRLMEPDPWDSVEENYHVGQLVTGVVTKLTDFGAFAALDDGIEGLIHISELAEVAPRHPSEVVTAETILPLIVVKIDGRRRRMGLSLKRVSEEEWFEWEEERRVRAEPKEAEPGAEAEVEAEIEAEAEVQVAEAVEAPEAEPVDVAEMVEPAEPAEALEGESTEVAEMVEPSEGPEPEEIEEAVEAEPAEEAAERVEEPASEEVEQPVLTAEAELASSESLEETPTEVSLPADVQETAAAAETPVLGPANETLMEEPPPEETRAPPLTSAATSFEPPDEMPIEGPPPEEEQA